MCGGDCICLYFDVLVYTSGWGVGVFPSANDSIQRLRADKTQQPEAIQTGKDHECRHSGEEKEIQP